MWCRDRHVENTTRRMIRCPKCAAAIEVSKLLVCKGCHRAMCLDCFGGPGETQNCKACEGGRRKP